MKVTKEEFDSWDDYYGEFEIGVEVMEYGEEVESDSTFLTLTDEHIKALEEGKVLYIEGIVLRWN